MKLFVEGFSCLESDIPKSPLKAKSFSSATLTVNDFNSINFWLVDISDLCLSYIIDVFDNVIKTSNNGSLQYQASLAASLMRAYRHKKFDTIRVLAEPLRWLSSVMELIKHSRSPWEIVHRALQLVLIVPDVCHVFPHQVFSFPSLGYFWPFGSNCSIKLNDLYLKIWSDHNTVFLRTLGQNYKIGCDLLPQKNFEVAPRFILENNGLEIVLPVQPYHRIWAHKFDSSNKVPLQDITTSVSESMQILDEVWPECQELKIFAQRMICYVPRDNISHNSASSAEFPFVQFTNVVLGSEVVNLFSYIHEAMHSKLFVLMTTTPLHKHGNQRIFSHPWMDIPRPADGVFLGAHAFINIMDLAYRIKEKIPVHREVASDEFQRRKPEVNRALNELEKMDLTDEGKEFTQEMRKRYEEIVK